MRSPRNAEAADGKTLKNRGPHRSATPKGHTLMNIKSLTTAKDPLAFVREGICRFNPAQANKVFNLCRYARNRNEATGKAHIDALARQMADGTWLPKSPIDFARLPDGTLTLVNGHHRMLAQVQSGRDIDWNVVIHDVDDESDVAALFWRFDTVMRVRSMQNVLAGVNASEELELSKGATVALSSAVVFIDNGLHPPTGPHSKKYTPAEKLALMADWQVEARIYDECVASATRDVRRKLFGIQVMAVGLISLRANTESAIKFWTGIAEDDGLRRGDPRKTLLDFLRDTHASSAGYTYTAAACARAWAAWENGKELTMIRVGRQPVRIVGTKMSVTP